MSAFGGSSDQFWIDGGGTPLPAAPAHSSGASSQVIPGAATSVLHAPVLNTAEQTLMGDDVLIDLFVPAAQQDPNAVGTAELSVSVPSAGISGRSLGVQNLSALTRGEWHKARFPLGSEIREVFRHAHPDVRFSLTVTLTSNLEPTLVDNFRFATNLQEDGPGCDPNAAFNPPVPAFTGTMNADGLAFEPNGLTAYVSGKVGSSYDIYVATRPTTNDPFTTPTLLGGISTPLDERAPSLLPSGAGLYVTYKSGGSADVAVAMKQAGNPPFAAPAPISGINSGVADQDPFWSTASGQTILYFASERPDGAHRDIYWTMPTATGFMAPEKLAVINSDSEDYRPVLTADGLTIYFASSRTGIGGDTAGDILMATRPNTTANFGAPVNLWGLNTSGTEFPVNVSADGCTLYFASNDATGQQHFRLYQAKRGASAGAQVTTTINLVGNNGSVATAPFNCSTSSTGNVGTCAAVGVAGTPMMVWANRHASWSGACVRNGANPSTDAVLVFANNGVCTVTFP